MKVKRKSEVAQSCLTLSDPMDCGAFQAPLSMGFSRQEYWSGLPLPSPPTFVITVIFIFGYAGSLLRGGGSLVCGTWA